MKDKRKTAKGTCKICHKPFSYDPDNPKDLCLECVRKIMKPRCKVKCVDCDQEFIITEGEAKYMEDHGFPLPKRCKDCRQKRKVERLEAKEKNAP